MTWAFILQEGLLSGSLFLFRESFLDVSDMNVDLRKWAKVAAVAVAALVVLLAVLYVTGVVKTPTVETVENSWGEVTNDTTEIQTHVVVDNPNVIGFPGLFSVRYTASLNDVVLVEDSSGGIGLAPGRNVVTLSAAMRNDRIAAWWPTHVNNGERTTLAIDPVVSGPGVSRELQNRTSTFETELLSSLRSDGTQTLALDGQPFLELEDQRAAWGTATAERTPLRISATVDNVHDYAVTLDGVEYVVAMNDVTLGNGTTEEAFEVEPGETGTLNVSAALDTRAFARWWPTHVRNDESSEMTVQMYGIVERNGTRTRLPLALYERRLAFETDLLGGGPTTVEALPTPNDEQFTAPSVSETARRWGAVTDATTEVVTDVTLAPGSGLAELRPVMRVQTDQRIAINDVTVAAEQSKPTALPEDGTVLSLRTLMDNEKVPEWWARHVNNGEQSQLTTRADTVVDVGMTKFDVETPDPSSTFSTDLLAGLNSDSAQPIDSNGRAVLVAESTSASWGRATPEAVPLRATARLRNERAVPVTVERIAATVELNGIVLADDVHYEGQRILPGSTATIELPMTLDNTKMDEWWVTHLRNGERSALDIDATATISVDGREQTIPLSMFSQSRTIETDILGTDSAE